MQIKIRCWDKNKKEFRSPLDWAEVIYFDEDGCMSAEDDDLIISVATGVFDKDGKEIYSGDLLFNNGHRLAEVRWNDNGFWGVGEYYVDLHDFGSSEKKIVGNIYNNPNLLK